METQLKETINTMLVRYFNDIMDLEARALLVGEFNNITNNDMHIIEAVGLEGNRMSLIAKKLNITVGSLTTSMNGLVRKGYVLRERSEEDRRVVNIYLTEKGIRAFKHHEAYHQSMTNALVERMTPEQLRIWADSFDILTEFFKEEKEKQIQMAEEFE